MTWALWENIPDIFIIIVVQLISKECLKIALQIVGYEKPFCVLAPEFLQFKCLLK